MFKPRNFSYFDTAVVIGAGNFAMDVARMLALEPSELEPTNPADNFFYPLMKAFIAVDPLGYAKNDKWASDP